MPEPEETRAQWPSIGNRFRFYLLFFLLLPILCTMKTPAQTPRKALILTAFGTSIPEAWATYESIEKRFAEAFPDYDIRWAFTAAFVRKKWRSQGRHIDSPASALARLADEGYQEVSMQSLHVIGGHEYHDLIKTVRALEGLPKGLQRIHLGRPLLASDEDYRELARILTRYSLNHRQPEEAWLMMGHGTGHGANISYAGLQLYLQEEDPLMLLGTLEAFPDLERAIRILSDKGCKTVWVMPLLTVAGDHVVRDMAGSESDSWKSRLEAEGYTVKIHPLPLGAIPEIVDRWIKKAKTAEASAP
ncbi:sirohydrochlorin cobaltochelatase [Geofilum rhodophaeum]|uniref:sirohydrochlorin cobaltochelatase n=1 Tax=Geofilum rhodophaeum TaxID=1965019 RepID=UPI000B521EFB|nr:sirohydrochlorin cobaltochelatase [Geofilum rhodophaeum]